ncbi:DUF4244 domain-containing protein [Leucobacter sp. USHLN153]|uniref:DUF4244 domain-containing protein n=1 Tax=Leucobacter sp. USHLN153 TaxID=3081268 RepID=UPI0030180A36
MQPTLQLVFDRSSDSDRTAENGRELHPALQMCAGGSSDSQPEFAGAVSSVPFRQPRHGGKRFSRWGAQGRAARDLISDERGAVTAEYAIVILGAVAFAGLLVAIMRSKEIRAMLVQLIENALGSVS